MKIGNIEIYGYIYKILNKSNKKVYIGQSCNDFNRRYPGGAWWKNTHNEHLKRAVNKYGVENFELIKHLDIAFSQTELDVKEQVYIRLYNSTHRDFGYNKRDGGNGKLSESSSRKISIKMLGYDIEDYTEEIVHDYVDNNMAMRDIAKNYDVNDAVIRRVLCKNNIKIKTSHELAFGYTIEDYRENIVDMYVNKKMSMSQISKSLNITVGAIKNNLIKWGFKVRGISESINARPKENERSWNANFVNVYNKNGDIVGRFDSNAKCAEWMVQQGICNTMNSARDGIYQSIKKNRYYKDYKFEYDNNKLGFSA